MNKVGDTLIHNGANEELVRALQSEGVEFVVVRGLAVAWYCSDRQADDMDLRHLARSLWSKTVRFQ